MPPTLLMIPWLKFDLAFTTGIETATLLRQLIETHFVQIVPILFQPLLCGSFPPLLPPLSFPNKTSDSPNKLLYMFWNVAREFVSGSVTIQGCWGVYEATAQLHKVKAERRLDITLRLSLAQGRNHCGSLPSWLEQTNANRCGEPTTRGV